MPTVNPQRQPKMKISNRDDKQIGQGIPPTLFAL
jgi:hypothetical protein